MSRAEHDPGRAPGRPLGARVRRSLFKAWKRASQHAPALRPAFLGYVLARGVATPSHDRETALEEAIRWLYRSQDAGEAAGSRCFRIAGGWSACYPEVTGYNLDTLFDHHHATGSAESRERAIRMAEWELTVQLPDGAFQGGYVDRPAIAIVFNTAQVLQGLARAFRETGDERFRRSGTRAADWLLESQDADGAWRRNCYYGVFRTTDTRVAYPLLDAWKSFGVDAYRAAAVRSLRYVAGRQSENGWFAECDNSIDFVDQPNTHTLAYTVEGFLESAYILDDEDALAAGRKAADAMLRRFEIDGALYGRYDARWRPTVSWACLTGCAQTAGNWLGLFRRTGHPSYLNAALKMNDYLVGRQNVGTRQPGIRGAIAGSDPIGGGYQPYAFPSWATKYFADALLAERRALETVAATSAAAGEAPAKSAG